MIKYLRITSILLGEGCVTLDERGKLDFPEADEIKGDEHLESLKKHWESFAALEKDERKKYLRSLEVKFSMNSMVKGKKTEEATAFMTDMFAGRKVDEQEKTIFNQVEELKNHGMKRSTDKKKH